MKLLLRQLLAGRDFARGDFFASQMANFVYLIGDAEKRECVIVDPAWDIKGLLELLDREELRLVGALVTHYHPDHVGGEIFGYSIAGISDLLSMRPVKIHVHTSEREGVMKITGASASDLVAHEGGDELEVGAVRVKFLHTPGHTPGSQCFLVKDALVAGDTLFIGGCGRVDLPGGNAEQMYYSLTQVLAKLPDETLLFPGHNYAAKPVSTIGEQRSQNIYMRMRSLEDWMRLMGVGS
jgi:hydroxyacylglutathione hydrolase